MKKTKNILKENIKKQLITESVKVDLVTTIGAFFTKKGAKITSNLTDLLNDLKKIPASDAVLYGSKLSELLRALPDNLFDELSDEIITLNKSSYDNVLNYSLRNGGTDFLQKASSKGMTTEQLFSSFFENSFNTKKLDPDISKKLSKKFGENLEREYKLSSGSTPNVGSVSKNVVGDWFTKSFPNFQTILRMFRNFKKTEKELYDIFIQNRDNAIAKMKNGMDATYELKKMADTLNSTRNLKNKVSKQIWEGMNSQGVKGWKDEIPQEIRKNLDYDKDKPWSGVMEAITKTNDDSISSFQALRQKKGGWKRLINFIAYGDFRTAEELVLRLQKRGVPNFLIGKIVTHFLVIPAIISALKVVSYVTVSGAEYATSKVTGERPDWTSWGESGNWKKDVWETFKNSFPFDSLGENLLAFIDFTYADELYGYLSSFILPGMQDEDMKKLENQAKEKENELLEELPKDEKNEVEKIIDGGKGEVSDLETADLSTLSVGKPINTEGAKKLGLSSQYSRYGKWANLVYVSPEEIKLVWNRDNPKVADEVEFPNKIIKKIEGEWYFTSKGIYRQGLFEKTIIRKKLIEYKKMKTIKESLKSKLQKKSKKVDVISENLYKVAGKFYNENYNEFFKKFEKLTENYKKSKLFLKEDSSESFNRALNKVFKGDESKLKNEAIPYFLNKLGLEGKIREKVKNELNAKYDDNNVGDLFLDCWADIVVQAFKDNAKSEISEPSNVMDAIEKIMVSKIDSPEFDYQLKKEICKMLKPAQEERQTKVQDLAKKLAQSIIDSSEA